MQQSVLSVSLIFAATAMSNAASPSVKSVQYNGACDGSAIVNVGDGHFLNASDEDNILRLYSFKSPGAPKREFDEREVLKMNGKNKEADLEAVAQIGSRLYWIGSHGRDKKADLEPSRSQLFATDFSGAGANTDVKPVGNPYRDLLKQLQAVPTAKKALNSAEPLAHTKGGIDIEGLAIAPNGKGLLIGMRSPLLTTKGAFVFTLKNPDQVIKGEKAEIGDTWVLDLGKAGIRAMEFLSASRQYLILAGPPGEGGPFALYSWTPNAKPQRLMVVPSDTGSAEGLMLDGTDVYVSIDEGERLIGGIACKDIEDASKKTFTLLRITGLQP
jgi:hypothetical protein